MQRKYPCDIEVEVGLEEVRRLGDSHRAVSGEARIPTQVSPAAEPTGFRCRHLPEMRQGRTQII